MIVTLKTVKYETWQYTGPDQNPLPPGVKIFTKECKEMQNDLSLKISLVYREDIENEDERFKKVKSLMVQINSIPPSRVYIGNKIKETSVGQAFLMSTPETAIITQHRMISAGDWIVKYKPISGFLPVGIVRSCCGFFVITDKEFNTLFDKE
jgi:hypothetical protein